MPQSLTTHLLALDPTSLHAATHHPFLAAAARNTLPTAQLTIWLAQDRLYALSYINFIATLLSKIPSFTSADRTSSLDWRITSALIDCLTNIRVELKLFEDVAAEQGWMEGLGSAKANRATRCYRDLFAGATRSEVGVLSGLVCLWATERCYLEAWKGAKKCIPVDEEGRVANEGVMQKRFIPNWSSDEFEGFVDRLGGLVDELGERVRGFGYSNGSGSEWEGVEEVWRQVLYCEREFWPDVES